MGIAAVACGMVMSASADYITSVYSNGLYDDGYSVYVIADTDYGYVDADEKASAIAYFNQWYGMNAHDYDYTWDEFYTAFSDPDVFSSTKFVNGVATFDENLGGALLLVTPAMAPGSAYTAYWIESTLGADGTTLSANLNSAEVVSSGYLHSDSGAVVPEPTSGLLLLIGGALLALKRKNA